MSVISRLRAAGVECYTRAEWGSPRQADGSYARRRTTHPMPSGPARYHFLHITVTPDTDTVLEGKAGARKVESYGLSTPPMVSYQDLVTNEGRYFEGQSYGVKGTHTVNDKKVPGYQHDLNLLGYAAAIMQNVGDAVTDEQVRVLAMIYAARELEGLVVKGAPIFPHRMFAAKACPGDKAVARLAEIVRLKNQYVAHGLPVPNPPPKPGRVRGLPTLVFNAVGAMPSEREHLAKRILRAAEATGVGLLIGVECDDLEPDDVDEILDPDVWWTRHRQSEHRDGVFLAGRRDRCRATETRSIPGAPASPVNDPRDILRTRITVDGPWTRHVEWSFTAAGLHVPRWREGGFSAATAMVDKSQKIGADLLAGDFNIRHDEMRRRYPGRTVRSREVMHIVGNPETVELGPATAVDLLPGTAADDHPGVRATVRPVITKE